MYEKIDAHAHYLDEDGYLARLLEWHERLAIKRVCLSGLGPMFGCKDNEKVAGALREHPDRVIGFCCVRPGRSDASVVDWAVDNGFRGIKVTCPTDSYDSKSYYGLWETCEHYGLPVLFHCGSVITVRESPADDISSNRMHPMMLEPISRAFPELKIICAHLGVHWNRDAAELARMRPNAYVDLTGEPEGWRQSVPAEGWKRLLWWPGALDKVLFGTDVHYSKLETAIRKDHEILDALAATEQQKADFFSGNMTRILEGR